MNNRYKGTLDEGVLFLDEICMEIRGKTIIAK